MISDGNREYDSELEYELRRRVDDLINLVIAHLPLCVERNVCISKLEMANNLIVSLCRVSMRTKAQLRVKDVYVDLRLGPRKKKPESTADTR